VDGGWASVTLGDVGARARDGDGGRWDGGPSVPARVWRWWWRWRGEVSTPAVGWSAWEEADELTAGIGVDDAASTCVAFAPKPPRERSLSSPALPFYRAWQDIGKTFLLSISSITQMACPPFTLRATGWRP